MYASRTACSRCLSQRGLSATQRLGSRAWYASQSHTQHSTQPTSSANNDAEARPAPFSQPQRRGQHAFNNGNDPALALFNDVVSHVDAQTVDNGPPSRPKLSELELAGKVNELTQRVDLSMQQKYDLFQTEIWPHIYKLRGKVPRNVFVTTVTFLAKVRNAIVSDKIKANSVELCQKLSSIGKWNPGWRNDLILSVCFRLMQELRDPKSTKVTALSEELIGLWKHVSQLKRPGEVGRELRFAMPSSKDVLDDIQRFSKSKTGKPPLHPTTKALASLFQQFAPEEVGDIMPGLWATLGVLSDPRLVETEIVKEAAPLLHLVSVVVSKHQPQDHFINSVFQTASRVPQPMQNKIKAYIKNNWRRINHLLFPGEAKWKARAQPAADPELHGVINISMFHTQLKTAYRTRNKGAVMSVWLHLNSSMEQHPELAKQIREDAQFVEYWIYVWCAIRRPEMVQETMQLMKNLKMEPTIKTYTAMMHGWKIVRDSARIEMLWKQLQQSGMELDHVVHTEYISSLIECGKPQEGVRALSDMMERWKKASSEGHPETAVRPTIEVINAAVKGLIRVDPNAANRILAWAGKEGFAPNIRTYNILLRESFRDGQSEGVQGLLKSMKEQGIEADAATFTVILEEVLGRTGDADPSEQVYAVKQVFIDIETAGLKPNMETYGKMLYAVAHLANGSDEAIAFIQTHMHNNGFEITPHMVTILVERALQRDPPDIATVRDLLARHKLNNIEQGDQTLWERVMTAFAIAGEKQEAMKIFDELADAGRPVTSLPCLTDLLKMLLDEGDREAAQKVVSVVLEHKLTTMEEFKERYWRHHFWFLAKQNRLLNGEQAPHLFR